jgi:hypothetical protein
MKDVKIATLLAKFRYQASSCFETGLEVGAGIVAIIPEAGFRFGGPLA